jgi:2,4-dienoyl-CoA reductase-like NADH-dependent reductase (Old Yellow Enzyme family)
MGHSLEKMAAFFEERAIGRVGLMVTGGIAPNNEGRRVARSAPARPGCVRETASLRQYPTRPGAGSIHSRR